MRGIGEIIYGMVNEVPGIMAVIFIDKDGIPWSRHVNLILIRMIWAQLGRLVWNHARFWEETWASSGSKMSSLSLMI